VMAQSTPFSSVQICGVVYSSRTNLSTSVEKSISENHVQNFRNTVVFFLALSHVKNIGL